jgi:hypothetical protein
LRISSWVPEFQVSSESRVGLCKGSLRRWRYEFRYGALTSGQRRDHGSWRISIVIIRCQERSSENIAEDCYQATAGKSRLRSPNVECLVVWKSAIVLHLLAVPNDVNKSSINPRSNSYHACSHTPLNRDNICIFILFVLRTTGVDTRSSGQLPPYLLLQMTCPPLTPSWMFWPVHLSLLFSSIYIINTVSVNDFLGTDWHSVRLPVQRFASDLISQGL